MLKLILAVLPVTLLPQSGFEIAEMVRDYISVSFNNDYVSNTVWVTTIANLFDDTGTIFSFGNPVTNTYLAFDGFGYFEDEINPQGNIYDLITIRSIRVYWW